MPLFLLILPFLKKYAVFFIIGFTLIGVLWYTYHKGYQACENKMNKAIIEQQIKDDINITKLENKVNELKAQLGNKPTLSDGENSCLLSNDPYSKECIK